MVSKGPWKRAPARVEDAVNSEPEVESTDTVADEAPSQNDVLSILKQLAESQARQAEVMTALQSRMARQESRAPAARDTRPESRAPARGSSEDVVRDRHGNVLVRRSFDSIDPCELPPEFLDAIKAEGYSVEWKSYSVFNQQRVTYMASLQANGHWTPVLNERLPGRYPGEPNEPICFEGLMLMERPAALTEQARREDHARAMEQVNMQHRNWGVNSKRRDYFDPDAPAAAKFTLLRRTLEQSDASWRPELHVASDGEM